MTRVNTPLTVFVGRALKITELLGGRVELRRHPEGGLEAIIHLPEGVQIKLSTLGGDWLLAPESRAR